MISPVDETDILQFVRTQVASAWMLELLLLLQRDPQSSWSCEALVRELRGTVELMIQNLGLLITAGLVAEVDDGYGYRPKTAELAALVVAFAKLYAQKRVTVLHTIFAPSEKIGR
jgi:hypothetical protein